MTYHILSGSWSIRESKPTRLCLHCVTAAHQGSREKLPLAAEVDLQHTVATANITNRSLQQQLSKAEMELECD